MPSPTSLRKRRDADLLHHRHDSLERGRCADGAHGNGLSPRGRRQPYIRNIRNTSSRSSRRSIEPDGRDKMVDVYEWHLDASERELSRTRSTTASTWRTTTIATRWASTLKLTAECAERLAAVASAAAARPARVGVVPLRQHRRQRACTTPGSIRSSPTSGTSSAGTSTR